MSPIQVDPPRKFGKLAPAVGLGILVVIGAILATNWRALILVLILLAAGFGAWLFI